MSRQTVERECPKCHSPLGARARYCGCGWTAEVKDNTGKSAGISDCAWLANGEQCHYPGTTSHHTNGTGPWYCRFHATQGISQSRGEQIVIQSRSYQPMTLAERDAQHLARLRDSNYRPPSKACEEKRCLRAATMQTNGRYLCPTHSKTPDGIEYSKRWHFPPPQLIPQAIEREPGQEG